MTKFQKNRFSVSFISIFVFALFLHTQPLFGLRWNVSNSLPYKLYLSKKASSMERGSYVSFRHPSSSITLLKQIKGLPGEEIKIVDNEIWLNGSSCGKLLKRDTFPQINLDPIESKIIPEGFYYMYASHPESYDSRYQNFGLIDSNLIEEVLWPIF